MKTSLFLLASALTLCASGAWYWPFGADRDSTNAPPRLHRLLEPANDFIELAQDASLEGDTAKALENYRFALEELDRVETEYPDRAASAEFAPLRLRRAACTAAIDAIRFAQVNENMRPVSVTDTIELEKRWEKEQGLADEEEDKKKTEPSKKDDDAKPKDEAKKEPPPPKEDVKQLTPPPKEETKEEDKKAAPSPKEEKKVDDEQQSGPPKVLPKDWEGRIVQAMEYLRTQDYAAADVLLESLQKERPKDLNVLLLRAGAQTGTQNYYAAQRTLERAMRAHPRSYLPYYNLANLLIMQGGDLESAREYYELGRTVGGPVNKALEARLKGVGK